MHVMHNRRQALFASDAQHGRQKRTHKGIDRLDSRAENGILFCMERTIFCVQPYRRTVDGLQKGHLRRLLSAEAALRAARAMRHHVSGVIVYWVIGRPDADYWSEPVLIGREGEVPDLSPEPLPDDTAYFRIESTSEGDTWTQIDPLAEVSDGDQEAAWVAASHLDVGMTRHLDTTRRCDMTPLCPSRELGR